METMCVVCDGLMGSSRGPLHPFSIDHISLLVTLPMVRLWLSYRSKEVVKTGIEKVGIVAHILSPSTLEAKAGRLLGVHFQPGLQVPGQPALHSGTQAQNNKNKRKY